MKSIETALPFRVPFGTSTPRLRPVGHFRECVALSYPKKLDSYPIFCGQSKLLLETNVAFKRMHKFALAAERAVQIYAVLTAFILLGSGVVYLWLGHWPVTHVDYWRIYDFCLNHTWLESALHKHYEHLIFFPSFFWLADLRFFHGKQLPLFLAGLTMLFLTVALLLIPVWRDDTVGFTAKIVATLVVILGNFWMARAPIIASGGFNCMSSLLMASATLGFVLLPNLGVSSVRMVSTLLVVCAAVVASFSAGIGLAIWPTLLFLAWCLRLPWRLFCVTWHLRRGSNRDLSTDPATLVGLRNAPGGGLCRTRSRSEAMQTRGQPVFVCSIGLA